MFCPYIRKSYTRLVGIHYDADGIEDGSLLHEEYRNIKCQKEQCGVWKDGHCNYGGDSHD